MSRASRLVAISVASFVVLISILFVALKGRDLEVKISAEEIQAAIDNKPPKPKTFAGVCSLCVDNTRVELKKGSDRITVAMDLEVKIPLLSRLKDLTAKATVSAQVSYAREEYRFYIREPVLESLTLPSVPEKYTTYLEAASRAAALFHIGDIPIYTIKDKNLKTRVTRAVLEQVAVEDGMLVVTLRY